MSSYLPVALVKTQGKYFNRIVSLNILYALGLEPTFAGRHALKPLVINNFVAGTSAVLKPSAARSTTTDSAGFLKRATLWAPHLIARGDD